MKDAKWILDSMNRTSYAIIGDTSKWRKLINRKTFSESVGILDGLFTRAGVCDGLGMINKDPSFEEYYVVMEENPLLVRGAYWYLGSANSWIKQYDYFVKLVEGKQFEYLICDFERAYNNHLNGAFAWGCIYFLRQLRKDFPDQRIMLYSGKYEIQEFMTPWVQAKDYKDWLYWHAAYPYLTAWDALPEKSRLWLQGLIENLTGKPSLPKGMTEWELWQIGANTSIGNELGFHEDHLDISITRRPLAEWQTFSGLWERIDQGMVEVVELRLEEKVRVLWDAHPELRIKN